MDGLTIALLMIFTSCMDRIYSHDAGAIMEAARVIADGGVVMHPTETCYGLAVDIFNEEALKKVYRLKGRDYDKPLSILVHGMGMANEYGVFSKKAFELAEAHWPGPLSLVVPREKDLPDFLNPGEKFVSIRFSSEEFCSEIVKAVGNPITTTSANVSGQDPLYAPNVEVFGDLVGDIDLLVDGGVLSGSRPSTVVKVDGDLVEVLRQGGIRL